MCIIAFMLIFNVEISYSISYYEISILRKNTGNITGNEENNTMELHITCIPGDGIGPEIVRETKNKEAGLKYPENEKSFRQSCA